MLVKLRFVVRDYALAAGILGDGAQNRGTPRLIHGEADAQHASYRLRHGLGLADEITRASDMREKQRAQRCPVDETPLLRFT
eukprot:6176189-Pleurochrysis_carterae.AAC.4